ncbi:MAG: hypothetical protein ABI047_16905 [Jatrophihabitantaceae bacterium]
MTALLAVQTRMYANRSWIRSQRRDIYDRFLTNAQALHIACEEQRDFSASEEALPKAFVEFFKAYSVIQTAAEQRIVDCARIYAWRLRELRLQLESSGIEGDEQFVCVSRWVRRARHDTIDAMRQDLGMSRTKSARPIDEFNPFAETPLADAWLTQHASIDEARLTLVGFPVGQTR